MANDIDKTSPHYKGEFGCIYEVNQKFPSGGVEGDYVAIDGWAHYWNADRGTWCVNAQRDSYWDELITGIIEKFKLFKGATYMGVAGLDTVPAKAIGAKMYYFATVAGTYKNFGGLVVPQGINVLYSENGSSWVCSTLLEVAQELGVSTRNVVSQKVVKDALDLKANQSAVNEALAKKADKETVNVELGKKFDKESVAQEFGDSEELVMSQAAVTKGMIVPNSYKLLSLGNEQHDVSNLPDWFMRSQVYPCVFDGMFVHIYKKYDSSKILYVRKTDGTAQLYSPKELGLLRNNYISYGYIKFKENWAYIKPFGVDYPQISSVGWVKENEFVKLPQINQNIEQASEEILKMSEPYNGELKDGYVIFGLGDDVITQNGNYKHYEIDCKDIDKFVIQKTKDSRFNAILLKFFDADGYELFNDSIYDASCFNEAAVVNVPERAKTAVYNYDSTTTLQVIKKSSKMVFVNSTNDLTAESSKGKRLILVKDITINKENTIIADGATIVFGTHHLIISIPNTKSLCSPATGKDSLDKIITLDYDREINPRPIYRTTTSWVNILSGLFKTKDNKVYLADFSYDTTKDNYNHFIPLFENFITCDFIIDRPMANGGYIYDTYNGDPSSIKRPVTDLCGISEKCTISFTENGFLGENIGEGASYEGYQHIILPITGSTIIRNGKFGKITLAICNPASLDKVSVKFDNCYLNAACIVAGPCYNNDGSGISIEVTNCKFTNRFANITGFAIENARIINNTFIDCARPVNGTFANSEFAYNHFENSNTGYEMITGMIFGGAMFGVPNSIGIMTIDAAKDSAYFGCELFNCNIHNNVFRDVTEESISVDSNMLMSDSKTLSRNQNDICMNRNLMVLDEVISEEYNGVYPHTRYQCARVHFVYEDKFIEQYDKHFSFVALGKKYFGMHTFLAKIKKDTENEGKYLIYSEADQFFQYFKAGELFAVIRAHVNNWIHNNIFYSPRSASVCLYRFGIDNIIENNEIYTNVEGQSIWAQGLFNGRFNADGEQVNLVKKILVEPTIGQVIRNNIFHTNAQIRLVGTGTTDTTRIVSEDYPIYETDGAAKDYDITDTPIIGCVIEGNQNATIVDEIAKRTYITGNKGDIMIRTNRPATDTIISGNDSSALYLMAENQDIQFVESEQLKQWNQSEQYTPTFKKGSTKFEDGILKYFTGSEWK